MDWAAIERLIASLSRLLFPSGALGVAAGFVDSAGDGGGGPGVPVLEGAGRNLGALDGVWCFLGLDGVLRRLLTGPHRDEQVIFGLVGPGRSAQPESWPWPPRCSAGPTSLASPTAPESTRRVSDEECYRSMDWLIDAAPQVEREAFWSVGALLDLDVDLLFFDTISTYFEVADADEPVLRDERGRRLSEAENPGAEDDSEDGPGRVEFRSWSTARTSAAIYGSGPWPGPLGRRPRVHVRGQPSGTELGMAREPC